MVAAVLIPAALYLLLFLRPTLYAFLDRESATVLGVKPVRWQLGFFLVLGLVVAAASKVAGSLLVFCYLVVPAATALLLSRRLGVALALAALLALLATVAGMSASFAADLPTNQTIVAVACAAFLVVLVAVALSKRWQRRLPADSPETRTAADDAQSLHNEGDME